MLFGIDYSLNKLRSHDTRNGAIHMKWFIKYRACLGLIWGNILTEKGHFFSISWKYSLFPSIFTFCMWVENHNGNLILTLLANIIATFCSAYSKKIQEWTQLLRYGWKWYFLAKKHFIIQKNIHNSPKTYGILLK